jgi:branched-chain amino acid transport system substrate-binding protein
MIMWGWGAMNATAVKEAAKIKYPLDKFIGNWWSAGEDAVEAAGADAVGYKAATFHGAGSDYPVYADLQKYVFDAGLAAGKGDEAGRVLYNRGLANAFYVVEAVRLAQSKYGNRVITGEEMQWALENLNLTEEDIAGLGASGLVPPVQVTCENHEGLNPAVLIQQWNGSEYEIVSDWVPAMADLTRPILEEEAANYAAEQGLTARDCG